MGLIHAPYIPLLVTPTYFDFTVPSRIMGKYGRKLYVGDGEKTKALEIFANTNQQKMDDQQCHVNTADA